MITALDSSIVLDVLTGETAEAERSLSAIRKASQEGKLIIGESVLAENAPCSMKALNSRSSCGIGGSSSTGKPESALLAGEMLARLLSRKKERTGRILADFLIGAHAQIFAERLLARDRELCLAGLLQRSHGLGSLGVGHTTGRQEPTNLRKRPGLVSRRSR